MNKKEDVFDLINKFYEYKSKYEGKYNNIKKKKDYKNLDFKGKKARLLNFKKKCVNCGNVGGTFFSTKTERLFCLSEKSIDFVVFLILPDSVNFFFFFISTIIYKLFLLQT